MGSEPAKEWQNQLANRIRVSQHQQNSAAIVLLLPVAIWGVAASPLGGFVWWICVVFLAVDAALLVILWRARRQGIVPLESAVLAKTLYEKPVTTFVTSAGEMRDWMAEVGIEERQGRTPRRDDLGALLVRPTGIHAIVSDRGGVEDLLVIGVGAIADVREVRPESSSSPYPLLRVTFTTGARPLDLDPYPPSLSNTVMPYEYAAAVAAESMRRVLRVPRRIEDLEEDDD